MTTHLIPSDHLSITDPLKFLYMVEEECPAAAALVANEWGLHPTMHRHEQVEAAGEFASRQNHFPLCELCEWIVVDGYAYPLECDGHLDCSEELEVELDDWDLYDEDDMPDDVEDDDDLLADAISQQPEAEPWTIGP